MCTTALQWEGQEQGADVRDLHPGGGGDPGDFQLSRGPQQEVLLAEEDLHQPSHPEGIRPSNEDVL